TLEWLLAAVEAARASGETVALVTETADEAAQWIGAVSHLTDWVHVQRSLSWTTFERARDLREGRRRGWTIVGVPREDVGDLRTDRIPGVIVADPTWEVAEPRDGQWVLPDGVAVPVSATWEGAALDVLAL